MVNLMWRCIRGFLTANWIGPATFRRGYAMIRPLKFDIDTQHSHSWKGNTSFPNYYFQYSSEMSRVYVLQLIYPRSTNHHFWNTKNAKRHEGESLLVIVFDGHFKRIETHYSNWITLASMVESKQCLKSPPAALFYFMSYEKQHKKSCNLLQVHVVEKLYTTLGPQNHEQWRFYTPNNIWVIAPKHKGFTWGTPMVTARSRVPVKVENSHKTRLIPRAMKVKDNSTTSNNSRIRGVEHLRHRIHNPKKTIAILPQ